MELVSLIIFAVIIGSFIVAYMRKISMTYVLIISNFIVFFITLVFSNEIYGDLGFKPVYLTQNYEMLYTLFTSMFVHGGFLHIFGNMIVFFFVGIAFERRIGWKKFLVIYLIAGVCGTLTHSLLNLDFPNNYITLIGASGAIFGIMGAFAFSYPYDEVMMPIPIGIIMIVRRVKVVYAVLLFGIIETVIVFIGSNDNTAHFAHLGGLFGGFVLAALLIRDAGPRKSPRSDTVYYDSYAPARGKQIDFMVLEKLANTADQKELLARIKSETIPQIRDAWVERFLETTSCPKCGNPLHSFESKIWCDNCGFRTKY